MPHAKLPLTLVAAAVFLTSLVSTAKAADEVKVHLASGRTFAAEVDPRTDGETLWLAFRTGAASILRPVKWPRVVRAEFAGKVLSGDELRAAVVPSGRLAAVPAAAQDVWDETPAVVEVRPAPIEFGPPAVLVVPKVFSVHITAHYANWDADVEADGLIVQVLPLGDAGEVVPVQGTVQAELVGVERIAFDDAPRKRGERFGRLGYWTRQITPIDCTGSGVWFKLPFQAAQPEFNTQINPRGLVHVKLVVPGQGVFESSIDGVRLRPWAPLRDAYQLNTGRRFFPTETTGRAKPNGW